MRTGGEGRQAVFAAAGADGLDPILVDDEAALCAVCGNPLQGEPEDQFYADGSVICAECYQAREFDQMLWEQGLQ